ncbi:MAG: hypothetical protein MZU84_08555 [Sphingobacterium sp.]|nr:hypothetical protein [Sphingobacterium sp.]
MLLVAAGGFIAAQGGADILAKLGLDKASAGENLLGALTSGYIYNSAAAKAFKALPAPAKVEFVRSGLAWVKAYTGFARVQGGLQGTPRRAETEAPDPVPSAEEQIAKTRADVEKGIANMQQMAASGDAEMKKSMEEAIKQMRAQMQEMEKPEMKEIFRQSAEMQTAQNKTNHENALKTWNENLPEDPGRLIANRIRQFLETSGSVDFSAELTTRGDRKIFAKSEYEQKPAYWKLCFRAGKEATEAARDFAKAWLEELK